MDTGIKIALPGYDARTAPDYNLSFSSNWPMEQITQTISHTVTSADISNTDPAFSSPTATITLTHNMGFYAFADVWIYKQDSNFGGVVAERLNSRQLYSIYFGKNTIKLVTATSILVIGDSNTIYDMAVGDVISVKVYSFDFTTAFSYAAILPPVGKAEYDPHIGIKIVRPGRNIDSVDLRDFIIHSKGSAPQILTIQTLENANVYYTVSGSSTKETVTYQIPNRIPARIDFLYSTDATSWKTGTGFSSWAGQVLESSTGLAYYASVFGQYDTQAVGDVSYQMSSSGLFTSFGLYKTVPFSVIVRRDPLLYSAPVVLNI